MVTTAPPAAQTRGGLRIPALVVDLVPVGLATLAIAVVPARGAAGSVVDDRVIALQLLAAIAMAVTLLTERVRIASSESHAAPPTVVALAVVGVGAGIAALVRPDLGPLLLGPTITCGVVGGYLACHGLRAPAVLRRVTALSFGTWLPVAAFAVATLRSTFGGVSDLVYRRLALLPVVDDPSMTWRLPTSLLSNGVLIPAVAGVLWWAWASPTTASRHERNHARTRIAAGAVLGLIVHHAVVLMAPTDRYSPVGLDRIVTGPALDLIVGAVVFVTVAVSLSGRPVRPERRTTPYRDPYLFGEAHDRTGRDTGVLVVACWLPLVAIALSR